MFAGLEHPDCDVQASLDGRTRSDFDPRVSIAERRSNLVARDGDHLGVPQDPDVGNLVGDLGHEPLRAHTAYAGNRVSDVSNPSLPFLPLGPVVPL